MPDLLIDFEARLIRQAQIEEDDIGWFGADTLEPFGAGGGDLHAVPRDGEGFAHLIGDQVRVVID